MWSSALLNVIRPARVVCGVRTNVIHRFSSRLSDVVKEQRRSVIVKELKREVSKEDLEMHMRAVGAIVRAEIAQHPNGESKGWGVVEFGTDEEARKAIELLHGSRLQGRYITVDANVKQNRPVESRVVIVKNLPHDTTREELADHMLSAGHISRVEIMHYEHSSSKGWGMVEYASLDGAQAAIESLNGSELLGKQLEVTVDTALNYEREWLKDTTHTLTETAKLNVSTRVFVGNLSHHVTGRDLREHMGVVGKVARAMILRDDDGHSGGCGVVEYSDMRYANRAIQRMNYTRVLGRPIFVREYRGEVEDLEADIPETTYPLYVGNLSYRTTWFQLREHFNAVGRVVRAQIEMEHYRNDMRSLGYGTVEFAHKQDAERAAQLLHHSMLQGRQIFISRKARGEGNLWTKVDESAAAAAGLSFLI